MKTTLRFCLAAVACSLLVAGCASSDTVIVDGPNKLPSAVLTTDDFAVKAEEMVASLLGNGTLDKAPKHPAVIAIGRIVNNTALHIDTDLLMKKIRVRLNHSGKAVTDTTGGVLNTIDYTFSGKIIDTYIVAGSRREHTYTFQLSLTDNQGLALWEDEKEVAKQTKKSVIGI